MIKDEDVIGKVFGRLTIVSRAIPAVDSQGRPSFKCSCRCGGSTSSNIYRLQNGGAKRCRYCHDRSKYPKTYNSWNHMLSRCYTETNDRYADYGGRGITVCDRWREDFYNFLEDMGERPEGMTLDRIEVNGNYEKDNCRWASVYTQNLNKRNTIKYAKTDPTENK